MRIYDFISCLSLLVVTACCSDVPEVGLIENCSDFGEIECNTENQSSAMSRTYYNSDNRSNLYCAKWEKEDRIAVCFDGAAVAREFNLLKGENSTSAVFYGPLPDTYGEMSAVYPFDIFEGRTSDAIEVCLPSEINYNAQKILCGAMPMFAHGTAGALNFYNLTGILKISVRGSGLLESISVSSVDGLGVCGRGRIALDENNMPILSMEDKGNSLTINFGSMFLSMKSKEIFLPIPATTYESGIKLEFVFAGETKMRILEGPLRFERSVMRAAIKPYEINVPFDFDNYETKDNEIWYKSDIQQSISNDSDLGISIISHSFSNDNRLGVITAESPIVKIGGPIFKLPQSVTFVKLPNTIEEIAMNGLKNTAIKIFEAPNSLRVLGTNAFLGCSELKQVILNDGLESFGLEVFGDCPNLESVFIPKTVNILGAYSFRESTGKLDHWDGDCSLIDEDGHSLYSNSSYGMVSDKPTMIDVIAGCNLTEYRIPDRALYAQNYAFCGCKKLKKLIIHENFRGFGCETFSSMTELEIIECYATTPPSINMNDFFSNKSLKEIRIPKNSFEEYIRAYGWGSVLNKIVAI